MCAFVTYTTRDAAELAAEKAFNKVIIHGRRLAIKWGKSQAKQAPSYNTEEAAPKLDPVPGLPSLPPPPDFFNLGAVASTSAGLQPAPPGTAPILPPVGAAAFMTMAPPPPPGFQVPPPGVVGGGFGPAAIHYPSQDPKRMGAT
jgi:pre-mRNA-splicing factor RBM22/SLT11